MGKEPGFLIDSMKNSDDHPQNTEESPQQDLYIYAKGFQWFYTSSATLKNLYIA